MVEPALQFYCQGTPIPQGSKSVGVTKDGRGFLRESNAQKLRPWRKAVKDEAETAMAGRPLFVGPLAVTLTFAFDRPEGHKGSRSWPSGKSPGVCDVDKATRSVLDSMSGTVYHDDVQVVSLTARKVWAEYDVDWLPGVLIWVGHVPGFVVPEAQQC